MAGRIPDQFIDELLNRVDVVDVVGSRVKLKRAGSIYKGCCPFHNEKTPSFTVTPSRQTYHCFGCGAHGSAIRFLMEFDGLEFPEAIEELARSVGLDVPREAVREKDQRAPSLYEQLEKAANLFQKWLKNHPQAEKAKAYLQKRGLSGEIAHRFGIGYAPDGWDHLLKEFPKNQQENLITTGMLIQKENGKCYDRFRQRIMFPIRDRRGRVIAFGGRVLDDSTPKYLNSPETPVFKKSHELYGLFEVLKQERHPEYLIVVEGYMDVIALAQHDINRAVATLGTAITSSHIDRLFKTSEHIVFCFDGDNAGRNAAWKALEISLPAIQENRRVDFLFLPQGHDPDSMVREKGKPGFEEMINSAQSISDYFFEHLSDNLDLSNRDSLSRFIEQCRPHLQKMPDTSLRNLMFAELAKLTRFKLGNEKQLEQQILQYETRPNQPPVTIRQRTPIRVGIALLLSKPSLASDIADPARFSTLQIAGIELFIELIRFIQANPGTTSATILERWRDHPHADSINRLARWDHLVPEEGIDAEFKGIIQHLESNLTDFQLNQLEQKMRKQKLSDDEMREWQTLLGKRQRNISQ